METPFAIILVCLRKSGCTLVHAYITHICMYIISVFVTASMNFHFQSAGNVAFNILCV